MTDETKAVKTLSDVISGAVGAVAQSVRGDIELQSESNASQSKESIIKAISSAKNEILTSIKNISAQSSGDGVISLETASSIICETSGAPPLIFRSAGTTLSDYTICGLTAKDLGGVGDFETENEFDGVFDQGYIYNGRLVNEPSYISSQNYITLDAGTYYIRVKRSSSSTSTAYFYIQIHYYDLNGNYVSSSGSNNYIPYTLNIQEDCKIKFTIRYTDGSSITSSHIENLLVQDTYDGAIIPVVINGTTVNVPVNMPLSTGQSISMLQSNVNIPTVLGDNTLTVSSAVVPNYLRLKHKMI